MSDASRHSQGCLAAVSSYRINEVNRSNYVVISACSLRQGNRCHVLSTIHASLLAFSARIEPFRTPPASCCLDLEGSDLHDNASFFVTSHPLVRLYSLFGRLLWHSLLPQKADRNRWLFPRNHGTSRTRLGLSRKRLKFVFVREHLDWVPRARGCLEYAFRKASMTVWRSLLDSSVAYPGIRSTYSDAHGLAS